MFTVKKQRFVEEYLIDANATQAAIRAGYSLKTAYSQGQRLLKDVEVKKKIDEAQQARAERLGIEQDEVLRELRILSFSNVKNYVLDDDGNVKLAPNVPEDAIRAVSSIRRKPTRAGYETEVKLWDKPSALQMVGKHLGMFVEKSEQTHKVDLSNLSDDDLDTLEQIAARLNTPAPVA